MSDFIVHPDRFARTIYTDKDVQPGSEIGWGDLVSDRAWGSRTPAERDAHAEVMAQDYSVWREVPLAYHGEYNNSGCWTLSNFRRIGEDFPEHVLTVGRGGHDGQSLYVRLGDEVPEELYDWIEPHDHSVYDESYSSDICIEIEDENWENWGRREFKDEMAKHLPKALHPLIEDAEDYTIDSMAADGRGEGTYGSWVCETSVSGYWEDMAGWAANSVK